MGGKSRRRLAPSAGIWETSGSAADFANSITRSSEYDAALRRRSSLTVWFTEEAIKAWKAAPRTTPGGQPCCSDLALTTASMLRIVFRLALRQNAGVIGSILQLFGLDLPVTDHTTLGRRARTVALRTTQANGGAIRLLVDSTGLTLCGPGEWLIEKQGTKNLRSWRTLHIGRDAASGRIAAAVLTDRAVDDAAQVGPLLDQVADPVAAFPGDRASDVWAFTPTCMRATRSGRSRCGGAVLTDTAETVPPQRDRHLQRIAETGRLTWQCDCRCNVCALVEAQIGRFQRVIGDALRSHTDRAQATELSVAVEVLNRMLDLGRWKSVRVA